METHILRDSGPTSSATPVFHLGGGFVGKGYGEDFVRCGEAPFYDVGDPVRQHAGLTAAGPGQNEQRSFGTLDSLSLRRI